MADDGKRSELVSIKVTERVALDLMRLSSSQDRSVSDLLYLMVRQRLYGDMVRLEAAAGPLTRSDEINRAPPE